MAKRIDLTQGPILGGVVRFAIPLLLGSILQQLYSTVDTLVIGSYCGSQSLAAIGTSSQPVEVVLCMFLGIGAAVSIIMSQAMGGKDMERARRTASTAVAFEFYVGVPLSIVGMLVTPFILRLMDCPPDVWDKAVLYTRLVLLGTLGTIGYNVNAGILRGLGDSKASLWFLIVSTLTNIVLDVVLVAFFRLDVLGAGAATTVAVFLSWFISIFYIRSRFPELSFPVLPRGHHREVMKNILTLGVPLGLNSTLFSFGHMALQTFVNKQGALFMAGCSISGRLNGLVNVSIAALGSAAIAFSGQNYGAENWGRLKRGHLLIPFTAGAVSLSLGLVLSLVRMPVLRLFSKDEAVLLYASRYALVMLLSFWIYGVYEMICKIINGVGQIKYSTMVNLLMLWAVRVPAAWLITRYFDGTWVMLCYPISFFFGMVMMLGFYLFSPAWKNLMEKA